MPVIHLTSEDDPRLEPYGRLPDRALAAYDTAGSGSGLCVAEGRYLVERLISRPERVHSLLTIDRDAAAWACRVPDGVPIYALPGEAITRVVGFTFHRGVIGLGYRPTPIDLMTLVDGLDASATLIVVPNVTNVDNLGLIARCVAGLGADALVIGQRCCDPYYRRSIRTSMGAVLDLPIARSDDIVRDLNELRRARDFRLVAAALTDRAMPLEKADRVARTALIFGEEGPGLSPTLLAMADEHVRLAMGEGVDSLNVAVSVGIFLYHYLYVATTRP